MDGSKLEIARRGSQRCANGECVKVTALAADVAVRDSTQPDGPSLHFSPADWNEFLAGLRAGFFHVGPE